MEIDLRGSPDEARDWTDSSADPARRFFSSKRRVSIFDIEHAVSAGLYEVDPEP